MTADFSWTEPLALDVRFGYLAGEVRAPRQQHPRNSAAAVHSVRQEGCRTSRVCPSGCGPIRGAVAREHAPGAVRAMGRRREPDDHDPRVRVAEAGHRPSPVLLIAERRPLLVGDPLPPRHQPGAGPALDQQRVQLAEGRRADGGGRVVGGVRIGHGSIIGRMSRACDMVANARWVRLVAGTDPPAAHGRMIGVRSPDQTPWPPTAEALMRSRFDAFRTGDAAWLLASWHPSTRPEALDLSSNPIWRGLQILDTIAGGPTDDTGIVEFRATFLRPGGGVDVQHERSSFVREDGRWYYLEAG